MPTCPAAAATAANTSRQGQLSASSPMPGRHDAVELARTAAHADVDVALEVTAGGPQVFQTRAAALDEAREATESGGRFIDRHTRRQ
ncbi:hypothetical protein ACWCYL_08780 [Streptomyces sp. 900105755]